ncbi:MAG: rRNA pseudouridine synthase [Candidatus Saccharimonas sp.]|nr:rRNA pseudouridine synthase [Candidatus Saccharimonas sp.]
MSTTDTVRLNKYLALQLGVSRREADDLIKNGTVTVNDVVAEIGARIQPADRVSVSRTRLPQKIRDLDYILLNKPTGYVCSRRAQGSTPTIYRLIPHHYHHLKPVGRLDANSSGLLLMTNDGDFANQMTHPKFHKVKIYNVRLDRDLEPLHQQMIGEIGIDLEDGQSLLQLMRLSETNRREWQVTMSEGRNRQIRRTFSALGYKVVRLHRTNFGSYSIASIKPGELLPTQKL